MTGRAGPKRPEKYDDRRGSGNPYAKLTESKVREIRTRYAAGGISQATLAKEYGVSEATIKFVICRMTWRHVE